MKTVTLKNGSEEAEVAVTTLMLSLRLLFESDPIGFYELVSACRDPRHQIWDGYAEKLAGRGLMQAGGGIHETVRAVVLSAVTGDDIGMQLGSPVAESKS